MYSLDELHTVLANLIGNDQSLMYSKQQLKIKLQEKYGSHIFFAEVAGKNNVICFRNMASCIISDKWHSEQKATIQDESLRIVVAASKLIKAQFREMQCNMELYPSTEQFDDIESGRGWVPSLLNAFLANVVCDSRKQVSLSHCIIQASRPCSVISPIPFGVGVGMSLDHVFGSQWLLNTLSGLGLSVSCDEVYRFKQFVLQFDVSGLPCSYPKAFTQFSDDNFDHNMSTLDGANRVIPCQLNQWFPPLHLRN